MNKLEPSSTQALQPLERARLVSQALADAARRARFSTRSRRRLQGGGFQARAGDKIFRWAGILSFWLLVVAPTAAAGLYFGLIASDQYVSEFKFTVAGAEPAPLDSVGALSGIPAISIIQDTQIVVNHLSSRAAVEALENSVGLRARFSASVIDSVARFDAAKPIEKLVRYWTSMLNAAIKMPAGIVEVKIRAFSRDDALAMARAALAVSEQLINDLNDRMNRDALAAAERDVERAAQRLSTARLRLETLRNDEGLLDVQRTADGIARLLGESKSVLLKLQQEYATQAKAVSERAPQMQALQSRILATRAQIAELEAKVTGATAAGVSQATLVGPHWVIRFEC